MMNRLLEKSAIPIIILTCLSAYLFFFQLGSLALTDPDETFYAQTAKEMVTKGEWLTPLGKLEIDEQVAKKLLEGSSFLKEDSLYKYK